MPVRNVVVLRTRLVKGEDIDRPLDICSLRGARETLRATTSRPFCDGATDFPQIRRSWTSPSLGRIHSRVWGQTHTRSNSPATPPTIIYRGCLPAAPHASRATGPLGGLRLCPTETGVTVRPAADRILRRGAIRPDGFGPRRQAGTAHKCAAFPYPPPGDAPDGRSINSTRDAILPAGWQTSHALSQACRFPHDVFLHRF